MTGKLGHALVGAWVYGWVAGGGSTGLLKALTKMVTGCLRTIKSAILALSD